jgi:hypothetical protein
MLVLLLFLAVGFLVGILQAIDNKRKKDTDDMTTRQKRHDESMKELRKRHDELMKELRK